MEASHVWPPVPTCHGDTSQGGVFKFGPTKWSDPRVDEEYGQSEPFRRCSYCGSVHPEDLLRLIEGGASLHGADWKYGWPHKFYVEGIPNLTPGVRAKIGSETKDGVTTPMYGTSNATLMAKFYNEHLMDAGYGREELEKLIRVLHAQGGILFNIDPDKGLCYRAPRAGYQKA
jgi:hypothetical protein